MPKMKHDGKVSVSVMGWSLNSTGTQNTGLLFNNISSLWLIAVLHPSYVLNSYNLSDLNPIALSVMRKNKEGKFLEFH